MELIDVESDEVQKALKDYNCVVYFYDPDTTECVHICGYKKEIDVYNLVDLFEELKTDEEFGMQSDYVDRLVVYINYN